ncbi:MAG: hypothetical protein J2P50_19855 [Hyphomicrobiaceae bacterium]|nr:hypothetical protein [Hyphomicrobiaceae bacterium]
MLAFATLAGAIRSAAAEEVNIYSYRQPQLIDPLLKAFTDKTGIKTNVVYAAAGPNERLVAEEHDSPADLLLTVDAGRLSEAKQAGVTQPVQSDALARDPDNHWFGLTMRSRVVYASKARVKQGQHHLRGAGRSQVERQVLRPLRPARLQYLAHRQHDRPQGRGVHREVAQRRARQPRAQACGRRPRAGHATSPRASATSRWATRIYMGLMMTNEKNPEQRQWPPPSASCPQRQRSWQPCQYLRRRHDQVCAEPRRGLKLMEFLASDEAQRV